MRSNRFNGNLVITNLPEGMTSLRLAELFDAFGMVIGAEIRPIPSNSGQVSLGLVALAPESAVDEAIRGLHHTQVDDRKIRVERAKPRPPKTAAKKPTRPAAPAPAPIAAAPDKPAARTVIVERKPIRRTLTMPVRPPLRND